MKTNKKNKDTTQSVVGKLLKQFANEQLQSMQIDRQTIQANKYGNDSYRVPHPTMPGRFLWFYD